MASPGLVVPIVLGAGVMLFSLIRLRSILSLLDEHRYQQYWLTMGFLMVLFFVGYLAAAWVVLAGQDQLLKLLTGTIFLLGGLFAFLVVHTGYATIEELTRSRDQIEEREQELEWLYEVTDVLNRILRHNLRNNMNVIIGLSELIQQQADEQTRDHVEAIREEAQQLVKIGDKAREIHETVDREVEHSEVDLQGLLSSVVEDVQTSFPDADVQIRGAEGVRVHAGPLLETAVENLVDNAIRHNDEDDPEVTVDVRGAGERVQVRVADNGPGIHPDELEAIREDKETPLQHGSGLGLWLVNWIVEQYEGELTFEDNDPTGTVVTVGLDRAEGDRSASTGDERSRAGV